MGISGVLSYSLTVICTTAIKLGEGLQKLRDGIDYPCGAQVPVQRWIKKKCNVEKELFYSPILTWPKKLIDMALPHLLSFSEMKPVVFSAKK